MRAQEFITEQRELPDESKEPMRYTYTLPGLSSSDPYQTYRMGVALARARSEYRKDDITPHMPEWSAEAAFGEHAVVAGFNSGIEKIIDAALTMTNTPGGKRLVSIYKTSRCTSHPASDCDHGLGQVRWTSVR